MGQREDDYLARFTAGERAGEQWLEQLDAGEECKHGRLPWDPSPDCGCWPTASPKLRLVHSAPQPEERELHQAEALERIRFLQDTHATPGMTYRTTAIAYNALYGTSLTTRQVTWLLRPDRAPLRQASLHALGVAA